MPYTDQGIAHAGSAEVLFTGMFDEPAGTLARTIPRRNNGTAALATYATNGTVAVNSLPLPQGLVVSTISILFGTTGATGPTNFWLALLDASLRVLAVSADQGAAAQTASAKAALAMTQPYVVSQTGLYYVAASSSAATTAPLAVGQQLATGIASTAGNPILCGTAGIQVAPPALGAQLAAGTVTSNGNSHFGAWIS